jgi:hypothetical protein
MTFHALEFYFGSIDVFRLFISLFLLYHEPVSYIVPIHSSDGEQPEEQIVNAKTKCIIDHMLCSKKSEKQGFSISGMAPVTQ